MVCVTNQIAVINVINKTICFMSNWKIIRVTDITIKLDFSLHGGLVTERSSHFLDPI